MTTNLSVRLIRCIPFAPFYIVLQGCHIEDEHGTAIFVGGFEGYASQHGVTNQANLYLFVEYFEFASILNDGNANGSGVFKISIN